MSERGQNWTKRCNSKVEGLSDADGYGSLLSTSPRITIASLVSHLRWTERGWFAATFPHPASGHLPTDEGGGWEFSREPLHKQVDAYEAECPLSRRVVASLDLGTMQEVTLILGSRCSHLSSFWLSASTTASS
ncbi:MAG: DUF664 domain-containing protein [Aeromicrobium sp.]